LSKGFSPPTIAEVRPSEGSFFDALQPEYGWNYEAGLRADLQERRLQVDITAYQFNLANAIVRRSAAGGGEYFVNAGGTRQKGIEATLHYSLLTRNPLMPLLKIWTGLTLNNYHFRNYRIDNTDFSGRELTGVPGKIFIAGLDVEVKNGFYLNGTYTYTSKLPLNDANSFYAGDYHLLQCKTGYRIKIKKTRVDIFAGADNIFNESYSLGNDINAAGNRFFNAAPLRNYFGGINFTW
jgi:iron complex outermembrane recepter protein